MDCTYRIDTINKIILVTVVGELNATDFHKLGLDIYRIALKRNSKVVFDFAGANIKISVGEAYFWFSEHLDNVNVQFRNVPTAHIASDKNWSFLHFVETTWTNRGVNIKLFKEEEPAIKWLGQFQMV